MATKGCKYLVDTGGIHPPLDALLMLRGAQELCFDLLEHADCVHQALTELMGAWKWIFEARFRVIPGSHGWAVLGMWAPCRMTMTCCDFSAMIGPSQFEEFLFPEIEEIARSVDYLVYHLDGPGALQHVPALLRCDAIRGIQWARGSGDPDAMRWVPLCRQIQSAGKVVQLGARYEEVEPLLGELDPRRLHITTGAPSVEAAEELLRRAKKWSCSGVYPVPKSLHHFSPLALEARA